MIRIYQKYDIYINKKTKINTIPNNFIITINYVVWVLTLNSSIVAYSSEAFFLNLTTTTSFNRNSTREARVKGR